MKNNFSSGNVTENDGKDRQLISSFAQRLANVTPIKKVGYVDEIIVSTVRANLPDVSQGELCQIETSHGGQILGEVIAFTGHKATITCLESIVGVRLGARVTPLGRSHSVKSHSGLFSKVLDGMGRKMGDHADQRGGALSFDHDSIPIMREAPLAIDRPPVQDVLQTGVRVIDSLMTLAEGQRLGVFAPPGCGKSTLIAQIARGAKVDAIVFGLVGERGRELREFIEHEISDDLRKRCIFVCSTSDRSPIERVRAAFTATSIAEHLRDQGKSVLLLIDSITRLARAQREVGLMAGEPIGQTGFTPSVYTILPELIERAGKTSKGCITAIYTVLMEKDRLEDDPIASEAKSLLDGHIVLSSKLVEKSHFPAIDPLRSLSRVMDRIVGSVNVGEASLARRAMALYDEIELLIRLNEYQKGSDPLVDEAIRIMPALAEWAKQPKSEFTSMEDSNKKLSAIVSQFGVLVKKVG